MYLRVSPVEARTEAKHRRLSQTQANTSSWRARRIWAPFDALPEFGGGGVENAHTHANRKQKGQSRAKSDEKERMRGKRKRLRKKNRK